MKSNQKAEAAPAQAGYICPKCKTVQDPNYAFDPERCDYSCWKCGTRFQPITPAPAAGHTPIGRDGSPLNWLVINPEGKLLAILDSESEAYWFTKNRGHADRAGYVKAECDYANAPALLAERDRLRAALQHIHDAPYSTCLCFTIAAEALAEGGQK